MTINSTIFVAFVEGPVGVEIDTQAGIKVVDCIQEFLLNTKNKAQYQYCNK